MCRLAVVISVTALLLSACSSWWQPTTTLPPSLVVQSLPTDYQKPVSLPSYRGPHPSQLRRPDDTFSFPIALGELGPNEPLFAGPHQYPFACGTYASGLGAPEVDNHEGIGTPVFDEHHTPHRLLGYSKDCQARTRVFYLYKPRDREQFVAWHAGVDDADNADVNGQTVPFIVRVEMGTINRFIYLLAALRGDAERDAKPSTVHWNRRLIYQFQGGVGIGFRQGDVKAATLLQHRRAELKRGYAVAYSTGNATTNHYHIWLQEDTALRVKRQFVARYSEPDYTIGIGGSGGGLQQYLLAQNRPGLIDAGIAQYAYPDMVTQTIAVFDCELLEYYFDVTAANYDRWRFAENRQPVIGFSASNTREDKYGVWQRVAKLLHGQWPSLPEGQTECAKSWRGLTPLVLNPRFVPFASRFDKHILPQVNWSHFDDVRTIYGTDERGFARVPWGNMGVQYGLQALRDGQLSPREFLRLNAHIGSWKDTATMRDERFVGMVGNSDSSLRQFSPWSAQNMRHAKHNGIAPRRRGDAHAAEAAFRGGLVFLGHLDIPIIDLRHYLDPKLDMHHSVASFSARTRIIEAGSDPRLQSIWMTARPDDPTPKAFDALEEWWQRYRQHPELGWAHAKPASADDRCFDANGHELFAGSSVWNGRWNLRESGPCQQRYPHYTDPRQQAGMRITGDVFNCRLQSVDEAIARGEYGRVDMRSRRAALMRIFPDGVCDYTQPDADRPLDLLPTTLAVKAKGNAAISTQ